MASAEQDPQDVLPSLPPLTERQEELLRYIWEYWQKHTYTPTQREMCEHMQIASTNPAPHLDALERKGYLRRLTGRRNIRITRVGAKKLEALGVLQDEQMSLFD